MGQVFGVKLHQKSMRTSRIDRCEPRYAGTEFTNRDTGVPRLPTKERVTIYSATALTT